MGNHQTSITLVQFFWFFVQTQIAIGIMTLPSKMYLVANTDGWISIILAGFLTQVFIMIVWALCQHFPQLNLFQIFEQMLGKFLGKTMIIFYIIYFFAVGAYTLLAFNFLISVWVLSETPDLVKIPLFVVACLYILNSSLRVIARFMTIVGPIVLLIPICAIYAFFDSQPLYLLPIFQASWFDIGHGALVGSLPMQGFIIVPILFPYVNGSGKEKLLAATYANILVTAIYTFTIIAAYVYFSPGQFELLPEPLLYMIKTISLVLIERIDLFFLAIWAVVVLATIVSYLYMIKSGMETVFNHPKYNLIFIFLSGIIISVLALIPDNVLSVRDLVKILDYAGIIPTMVIPTILLIFAMIFKRRATT